MTEPTAPARESTREEVTAAALEWRRATVTREEVDAQAALIVQAQRDLCDEVIRTELRARAKFADVLAAFPEHLLV